MIVKEYNGNMLECCFLFVAWGYHGGYQQEWELKNTWGPLHRVRKISYENACFVMRKASVDTGFPSKGLIWFGGS